MTVWSRICAAFRRWRHPASWERAVHDELQSYLDHEIEARVGAGMSPAEARRTALADFGGVEQVKEHVRSSATGAWVDAVAQDIRYASRSLRSSRSYSIWVVGSLAIGMAVTIAALAVLNALLVLPFPEVTAQHRLARVTMLRNCGRPDCWIRMAAPADYEIARQGFAGVQSLAAYAIGDTTVALPDARSVRGVLASANYFDVLGVRPALGRMFTSIDADTHAEVAVIAHSLWLREFDGDPSAVGRTIRVADRFVQIVGVAPPLFEGIDRPRPPGPRRMAVGRPPDVWLPMWLADGVLPLSAAERRRQERDFQFVGRLMDRVELPQLQAGAAALARGIAASKGEPSQETRAEVLRVWRVNPRNWPIGIAVVMPIPILVLAIACVNAANLMLARGSQRQRELAIRLAIGAGRGRIVRQLLIESASACGAGDRGCRSDRLVGPPAGGNPVGHPTSPRYDRAHVHRRDRRRHHAGVRAGAGRSRHRPAASEHPWARCGPQRHCSRTVAHAACAGDRTGRALARAPRNRLATRVDGSL